MKEPLPFPLPKRTLWIADLLTLEEIFEELYTRKLIERKHYVRYVALRTALWKLAEIVLLAVADKLIFEGDPPETAGMNWPEEADQN
jgi:hypothetical protein